MGNCKSSLALRSEQSRDRSRHYVKVVMDPKQTDVLIVGAGPSGLMAALTLARCGIRDMTIVDKRPTITAAGHACGLQPRTQELLHTMGLHRILQEESSAVIDTVVWGPPDTGEQQQPPRQKGVLADAGIERLCVLPEAMHETPYGNVLCQDQGQLERVLDKELNKREIFVKRQHEFLDVEYPKELSGKNQNPVRAYVKELGRGIVHKYHCRYLIAADGASSLVRHYANIDFVTEDPYGGELWIAADCLVQTDFPDFRRRCVIRRQLPHMDSQQQQYQGGIAMGMATMMMVPIQGGMTRIYFPLDHPEDVRDVKHSRLDGNPASTAPRNNKVELVEVLKRRVPGMVRPWFFEIVDVEWIAKYKTTPRVLNNFTDGKNILFVGESCHSHTPVPRVGSEHYSTGGGDAQGLNAGIQDAANLAWKMALVLKGRAAKGLLETYSIERKDVAQKLFDLEGLKLSFPPSDRVTADGKGRASVSPPASRKGSQKRGKGTKEKEEEEEEDDQDPWARAEGLTTGLGVKCPARWPLIINSTRLVSGSRQSGKELSKMAGGNMKAKEREQGKESAVSGVVIDSDASGALTPGKRFSPMSRLVRHVDGRVLSSLDTMPMNGEFWVVLFAGDISEQSDTQESAERKQAKSSGELSEDFGNLYDTLARPHRCILDALNGPPPKDEMGWPCEDSFSSALAADYYRHNNGRKLVNLYVVHTTPRHKVELRPQFETWKWNFFEDPDGREHKRHGVFVGRDSTGGGVRKETGKQTEEQQGQQSQLSTSEGNEDQQDQQNQPQKPSTPSPSPGRWRDTEEADPQLRGGGSEQSRQAQPKDKQPEMVQKQQEEIRSEDKAEGAGEGPSGQSKTEPDQSQQETGMGQQQQKESSEEAHGRGRRGMVAAIIRPDGVVASVHDADAPEELKIHIMEYFDGVMAPCAALASGRSGASLEAPQFVFPGIPGQDRMAREEAVMAMYHRE